MRNREHFQKLLTRICGSLAALIALFLWLAPIGQAQAINVSSNIGLTRLVKGTLTQNQTYQWNVLLPSNATSLSVQIENTGAGGLTYIITFANPSLDTTSNSTGLNLVCSRYPNNNGLGANNLAASFATGGASAGTSDYYSCPWPNSQHLLLTVTPTTANPSASIYIITNSSNQLFNLTATSSAGTLLSSLNEGAAISEKGARWSVFSIPATGSQATASKAAGAAGVRHVADCISYSAAAAAAPVATTLVVSLRDGASGAGTVLWTTVVVAPATSATHVNFNFCGLNLIGSSATAMTLEFNNPLASENESVTLTGYDVQ